MNPVGLSPGLQEFTAKLRLMNLSIRLATYYLMSAAFGSVLRFAKTLGLRIGRAVILPVKALTLF